MITFLLFLLIASAAVGAHRIYNYEDIFYPWRRLISGKPLLKPLWCPSCNAFWAILVVVLFSFLVNDPWRVGVLTVFAVYPWIRVAIWLYAYATKILNAVPSVPISVYPQPAPNPTAGAVMAPAAAVAPAPTPTKEGDACVPCEAGKKAAEEIKKEQGKNLSYEKRFVLMTMFNDFKPSYSLTSVVLDQARMLAANPKWLVQVWVTSICNTSDVPSDLPSNVEIKKVLPPIPLPADEVNEKAKAIFFSQVLNNLMVLGNATIIAHDLLFISSYTTIAAAIHEKLGAINGFTWYHACHSAPSTERPTGPVSKYRASLPAGHKLICLAASQASALAAYYGTTVDQVVVIPNARDIRALLGASPRISEFIRRHELLDADIVQVLPLSTPRAKAKGIERVIDIFGELTTYYQQKVRLVIPNAHANGNHAIINELKEYAAQRGLGTKELIFTSDEFPELASVGLPTADITALFQVSNLFVFPTVSEACSMTLMEAALAGCLLILNEEVASLRDIVPAEGARYVSWNRDLKAVAFATMIHVDLMEDVRNRGKRAVLRTHSWDAIGARLRAAVSG